MIPHRTLRQLFDDFEQFRAVVAVLAAEGNELDRLGEHRPTVRCSADPDAASLAKLEQPVNSLTSTRRLALMKFTALEKPVERCSIISFIASSVPS